MKSKPAGIRKKEEAKTMKELRDNYWAKVQKIETQIGSKKRKSLRNWPFVFSSMKWMKRLKIFSKN